MCHRPLPSARMAIPPSIQVMSIHISDIAAIDEWDQDPRICGGVGKGVLGPGDTARRQASYLDCAVLEFALVQTLRSIQWP